MVSISWRLENMHSYECSQSPRDISALYIKERVNGKERFVSMAAYCECCGAISIYPEREEKNRAKFEIVKRRRTPNFI